VYEWKSMVMEELATDYGESDEWDYWRNEREWS
jgi:hypothetical protein